MRDNLPIGFKFRPTDRELVKDYLLRKVRGQQLPWNGIRFCDLYGDKSPSEIFEDSEENELLVFTRLKKASLKRVSRVAGCGTWHGETVGSKIYADKEKKRLIGLKKTFSFKVKNESKKSSQWIMHEFSLAGEALIGNQSCSDYVVCRLHKNKRCCLKEKSSGVIGMEREGFGYINWVNPSVGNLNFNQKNGAGVVIASLEQTASVSNFSCFGENSSVGSPSVENLNFDQKNGTGAGAVQAASESSVSCFGENSSVGNQAEGCYSPSKKTSFDAISIMTGKLLELEYESIENYGTTEQSRTGGQNLSVYKDYHLPISETEIVHNKFRLIENPDLYWVNVEEGCNIHGFGSKRMFIKDENLLPIQKNNNEVGMIFETETDLSSSETVIQDKRFLNGTFQCPNQIQDSSTSHQIEMSHLGDHGLKENLRQEKHESAFAMDLEDLFWNDDQNFAMDLEDLLWDDDQNQVLEIK